ncbi:hypothetical protein F2Q70_00041136 [Brassica cretica]|uniref:EF-hand domain-containing protein n=1 Tax=Brassica cretica TaxID=69181 RepID=A0A8S9K821_BRACR|nr:hypothetical protein F2Q70_00041136 [Brassica cretica]KAF2619908.1 hypothetical protein F2Q68_00041774 [Brassica cretica]KAF3575346.1 hypothetical protein F2Q69_00062160 [Brassica cretica]
MFDKNGDGRITKEELNDSLENLGIFMPDKDLIQMIQKMDANGDGCVDINEFESLYGSIVEEKEEEQGKTLKCCKEMITQVDEDGDGRVNYKEFLQMMKSGGFSNSSSSD